MKIKLTETQYNRILTEDKNYGRLEDTFQQYMVRVFKLLGKKNLSDEGMKKTIKGDLGLSDHETNILLYNYRNKFLPLPIAEYDSLIGEPIEFVGTYKIAVDMPTVVSCRTYIAGFVEVTANSKEDAINKVENGTYERMYLDTNSLDFMNPEFDFDLPGDGEIMEEMTLDYFRDIDWSDEGEVEDRVNLKI
jgi:hypothetical protein